MRRAVLGLFAIVLIASLLSISLFSNGHFWWDDFASYLMQSRAILQGQMDQFVQENGRAITQSTYPVGPAAYPWGYPLLISPIMAVWGVRLVAYKFINTLAFDAFLICFFLLLRRRFDSPRALALTALLAFSPALLVPHDLIQADFVFLFLASSSLLMLDTRQRIPAAIFIFLATFTRTNGILLLGALFAADVLDWRAGRRYSLATLAAPYLVFGALYLASRMVFPSGEGSYFSHYAFFTPVRLWENVLFYLTLPGWLFRELPGGTIIFIGLAGCFLWGLWQSWKKEIPALVFALLSLAVFISWPERQGLRFIYPLLPVFLLFALYGLDGFVARWGRFAIGYVSTGLFAGLAALALLTTFQTTGGQLLTRQQINGPFDEYSQEMFAFVSEKTPKESVIVFFKPRAMRLLGDRYSILLETCQRLPDGDYIVLNLKQADNGQVDPEKIDSCGLKLETVFRNKRFVIYQQKK